MQKVINQIELGFTKKELGSQNYLNSGGWITEHNQTKFFEKLSKFRRKKVLCYISKWNYNYVGCIALFRNRE